MAEKTDSPDVRITLAEVAGNELVIRTGAAAPIELPQALSLEGSIDCVSHFVQMRKEVLERLDSHILVDRKNRSITLVSEERDIRKITVKGVLARSVNLSTFTINSGKRMDNRTLVNMLRLNRRFFTDRAAFNDLVKKLDMFKARVETEIKATDNRQGHVLASLEQKLTHEIPLQFKLRVDLFQAFGSEVEFIVDIVPDITDGGVQFYLESIDLLEIEEERIDQVMAAQEKLLTDYVIIHTL